MRTMIHALLVLALASSAGTTVYADEAVTADPLGMWECPQAGDIPLYTNRERPGCRKMDMKPLSVVPALPEFPARPQRTQPLGLDSDHPAQLDPPPPAQSRNIPDWGNGWYASNTSDASVQWEVCTLYSEWLQLIQRTRGGFAFGTDSSYGADPSRRNYTPSNPFWDNARYVTLANIFGRGFVPIGCL